MAQQDVRYYLNGLLFEISKNKLVSVATDGHRLSKSETAINGSDNGEQVRQAIIPRKAVTELNRLLNSNDENVTVELNDHHIRFTFDQIIFTSKLIDGKFPDYQSVMSAKLPVKLRLERQEFYQTLLRASILTNDKFRGIRLGLNSQVLKVASTNPEQEEANDEMPINDYDGPEMEIGFNVNYLMDILKVLDSDEVELSVKDGNSSCTLNIPKDTKSKYLVMPMRL
jgi:DNA polymerase-3 subunit beta